MTGLEISLTDAVAAFDYNVEAELFTSRSGRSSRTMGGYRRFARGADAVRFAIEELSPRLLLGACLEVDEQRYGVDAIRRLYECGNYPLVRSTRLHRQPT
jgi:hypothetical protein